MSKPGHLCLSRKPKGKRIKIITPDGTEIWIGIQDIRRDRAVILIEADQETKILREEIIND